MNNELNIINMHGATTKIIRMLFGIFIQQIMFFFIIPLKLNLFFNV